MLNQIMRAILITLVHGYRKSAQRDKIYNRTFYLADLRAQMRIMISVFLGCSMRTANTLIDLADLHSDRSRR